MDMQKEEAVEAIASLKKSRPKRGGTPAAASALNSHSAAGKAQSAVETEKKEKDDKNGGRGINAGRHLVIEVTVPPHCPFCI